MQKQAQEKPEQKPDSRRQQIQTYLDNITANLPEAERTGRKIIANISSLQTITDYIDAVSDETYNDWETIKAHYKQLLNALQTSGSFYKQLLNALQTGGSFRTASLKYAALPQFTLPDAPPANQEVANDAYSSLLANITEFTTLYNRLLTSMISAGQAVETAKDEPWAVQFAPQRASWIKTRELGWDLGLTKKVASKVAYPIMYTLKGPPKKQDLDKWRKTAIQMNAFKGVASTKCYTFAEVLYHFTNDWDMFERYDFKKWYKWNDKKATSHMKKTAQAASYIAQDRIQQWTVKKKKLMNRVNLVRKALQEFITSGLIDQTASNKIYKIISMLEFETMQLGTPKVAAARVRRVATKIARLGFSEGEKLLVEASNELLDPSLVKIATTSDPKEAVSLLREIKSEMDSLSYSRHLDKLFNIKKQLEGMGRAGDAEAIEKIIRDDLAVLEKLNKKLIEVYTNLSRVPLEMSEESDRQETPKEKVIETPIEVTEDDLPKQEKRSPEGLGKPAVMPKAPVPRPAARPAAPRPALQTRIPNV